MNAETRQAETEHRPVTGPFQMRLWSVMVVVAVVAIWLGMLGLPGMGALLGVLLGWVLAVLAILAGAMGLGWIGFQLFGAFDRLAAWSSKEPEWFHPDPVEGTERETKRAP